MRKWWAVGVVVALALGSTAVVADAAPSGLVKDPGFENQTSRAISAPWGWEGSDPKGVDVALGLENTGRNNAWIRAGSRNWNALTQKVTVTPNTEYALGAWVRVSGNFTGGYFGARTGDNRAILNEVRYGAAANNPGAYQYLETKFNSGANTSVIVFLGYWAPGADSWVQVDDVDLGGVYSNWAGYAMVSSPYNQAPMRYVAASWVQPAFNCNDPNLSLSMWVGLGGFNTSSQESLVQIGTAVTCITRNYPNELYARHDAFYEVIDGGSDTHQVNLGLPLLPGDVVTASVSADRNDPHRYTLYITNSTRNWTWTNPVTAPHSRNLSAEVVVERPKVTVWTANWPNDLSIAFRNVWFDGGMPYQVGLHPLKAINDAKTRVYAPTEITSPLQDGFTVRSIAR